MADTKISSYTSVTSVADAQEGLVNDAGTTKKFAFSQVKTWILSFLIPGGSDTQIQYNDGGAFGGDANLTWDKANGYLTLGALSTVRSTQAGTDEAGHDLVISASNASGTGNLAGGNLTISAGTSEGAAAAGSFTMSAGAANGSAQGGGISVVAGGGDTGAGGDVYIAAGDSSTNNGGTLSLNAGNSNGENYGGNIILTAGYASDGDQDGGSIRLIPGDASGSGVPGYIIMFNLPTSDPGVSGALYTVAGALMVSP